MHQLLTVIAHTATPLFCTVRFSTCNKALSKSFRTIESQLTWQQWSIPYSSLPERTWYVLLSGLWRWQRVRYCFSGVAASSPSSFTGLTHFNSPILAAHKIFDPCFVKDQLQAPRHKSVSEVIAIDDALGVFVLSQSRLTHTRTQLARLRYGHLCPTSSLSLVSVTWLYHKYHGYSSAWHSSHWIYKCNRLATFQVLKLTTPESTTIDQFQNTNLEDTIIFSISQTPFHRNLLLS